MIDSIQKEIEKLFALQKSNSAYILESVGQEYKAWVFREYNAYGVFVLYEGDDISESFSQVNILSKTIVINKDGSEKKVLQLKCENALLRKHFATICAEFVNPGKNGEQRSQLIKSPMNWWNEWRSLLGDTITEKLVYDIVGELWAVLKLFEVSKKPYWSASKLSTHDIELTDESYEVKTTTRKDVSQIHANSQFQMGAEKPLYLIFTRLEESETGKSIDELMAEIKTYDPDHYLEYNSYLCSCGFGIGNHNRKIRYTLLERNKYLVDDSFPRITNESFKENKIPDNISHIEYVVDLSGLSYETWK